MKNVFYLGMSEDDAVPFYRTNGVLPFIKSNDISIKNIFNYSRTYGWENLIGADVFIIQRPYHEHHANLIRIAKDIGIKVICDYDDDLLNIPVHNPSYNINMENRYSIFDCIKLADEVWASTPSIKEQYSRLNDNIHVIPNAHNDFVFPLDKKKNYNHNTKIASYRGGVSHDYDVYSNYEEIISTINNTSDWEFRFHGSRFKAIEIKTKDNHTYTEPMTLMQFFKTYYDLNANIAFFPLLNNVFNHGKSNISFLEATYAGAAFMGNRDLPEFNHDFVIDISCDFRDMFFAHEGEYRLLEKMNNDAWDWILENRLLSDINKLRIERILS